METATRFRRQPRRGLAPELRGWRAVLANLAAGQRDPAKVLQAATNMRPQRDAADSGWTNRPGFSRYNSSRYEGGTHPCIGLCRLVTATGTSADLGVWNGKLINVGSGAAYTLSGATIQARDSGPVYLLGFGKWLVVSDGATAPWYTTLVGSPITCIPILFDGSTNEPAYGRPATYYGKLFFIRSSDRREMVWSEEGDPSIGYKQTGYANNWVLTQTATDPLCNLFGTNDGLYVFRSRSTTKISGQVFTNFSATGTREGVSEDWGCLAGDSITSLGEGGSFIFADQLQRIWAYAPGSGLTPWWPPTVTGEFQGGYTSSGLDPAYGLPSQPTMYADTFGLVLAVTPGNLAVAQVFTVDGRYCGTWAFSTAITGGTLSFGAVGVQSSAPAVTDEKGGFYFLDWNLHKDVDYNVDCAFAKQIVLHPYPYDEGVEYLLDTLTLGAACANGTVFQATVKNQRNPSGTNYNATASTSGYNNAFPGTAAWALNESGRSHQITIADSAPVKTQVRLYSLKLGLVYAGQDVGNP
jgi:hypothetical protein